MPYMRDLGRQMLNDISVKVGALPMEWATII